MEIENISFTEAAAKLGEPLNIKIEQPKENIKEDDMVAIKMHDYLSDLYHHLLMNTNEGDQALQYLIVVLLMN